jgi:uncharacterized protein (UPF0210 family)
MRIRSITAFFNPGWPIQASILQGAGAFLKTARQVFSGEGFEIQSLRMATPPFPLILNQEHLAQASSFAQAIEAAAIQEGIEYIALGPAMPENVASYAAIPDILLATNRVFVSGGMTTPKSELSLPAIRACAQVIFQASRISPDGFGNLRFAALGNVPPGSPFFPAAYSNSDEFSFAIATEAADLAVEALAASFSLVQARQRLITTIETAGVALANAAEQVAKQTRARFGGIDFTLAPYPDQRLSLGYALERCGVPAIGLSGSTAAAAFLADSLDRASFPRVGFSGLFFPVLEDATLALRAAEGMFSLSDLLLYCTVCGTGLDCVPLPGDASPDQIYAILVDLAALSLRLNKPLTARLMPIPGKSSGEPTGFDFSYFANSRIMPLTAQALRGLLAGSETIEILPRKRA